MLIVRQLPSFSVTYRRSVFVKQHRKDRMQLSCFCSSQLCASSSENNNPKPWLLVGLGNPGKKYQGTRHNVGFDMIDYIAKAEGISFNAIQSKALIGKGNIGNTPVLIAKPQTFMNLSGEAVGPLLVYYKIPFQRTLLMFDTMELPCGVLRLRPRGGQGRHMGDFDATKTPDFVLPEDVYESFVVDLSSQYVFIQILGYMPHNQSFVLQLNDAMKKHDIQVLHARLVSVIEALKGNKNFWRLSIGIGNPPGIMDPKAYVLQCFTEAERKKVDTSLEEGADAVKMVLSEGFSENVELFNRRQKYSYFKLEENLHKAMKFENVIMKI